jgi:hypothetical protein
VALQRAYLRQLMLGFYEREPVYNEGPDDWATAACSMLDYDDASGLEQWDDTHQTNQDVISGHEFITFSEIPRQSMRVTYTEPRVKPNTMAGLLALTLGNIATTQDGATTAFRHYITPANAVSLPSIGVQTKRDSGVQRMYTGVKADSFTLSENGPYFQAQCALIGSGSRTEATEVFPAQFFENWMRWGDAHIYVKDNAGVPFVMPPAPSQTTGNLGTGAVDFSTRVLTWQLTWTNNLQADQGYRASTGVLRHNFHPLRRRGTLNIRFETDTATEAQELNYYLQQTDLAFELNINSGKVIGTPAGIYTFGAIFIVPRVRLTAIPRSTTNDLENIEYQGEFYDDLTNPVMAAWVYNDKPTYLA